LNNFIYFLQVAVLSLVFLYGYVILKRLMAWQDIPELKVPDSDLPQTFITVIIPIRNEEENIKALLQDLLTQTYTHGLMEVLVIDDDSEDNTSALVMDFAQVASFPVKCLPLEQHTKNSGKKAAVQVGVAQAAGELLVFTDGDCRVQPNWLRHIEYLYRQKQAKFISGLVCFSAPATFFEKMQLVEFAALIGVGAGSMALKQPNMCNGANIAYPKHIFKEVNGFAGNEHIPSGDDEFLMHKVFQLYPELVLVLKSPETVVYTGAKKQVSDFFAQRVRWASKWPAYQKAKVKLLAVLVFGVNFSILLYFGLLVLGLVTGLSFVFILGTKCLVDLIFLKPILSYFQKQRYWLYVIPLQLVYIPYVVLTALAGLKGAYKWKGRTIKI